MIGCAAVDCDRLLASYDYTLPSERIAQTPAVPRDSSRLLVVNSQTEQLHTTFRELPQFLQPGDLLILNNTRVLPARLFGHKPSGLPVEILLLEPQPSSTASEADFSDRWLALVKPGRRLKPGTMICFDSTFDATNGSDPMADRVSEPGADANQFSPSKSIHAKVLETDAATSGRVIQFEVPAHLSLKSWIYATGHVPLPPYINTTDTDPEQYQTVYADRAGAVAAPTAGLHFTSELLDRLQERGIQHAFVTLHVGVGTFRPVEADDITAHEMHSEWAEVSAETVELIHRTQASGGRVIAVGTTVVRALEGASQKGQLQPFCGKTNLFIYPGYQWRVVQGLITNFHLPKSSLMMLVSALIGRERLLALYQLAIAEQYRFYSFGDAMLILPEARLAPSLSDSKPAP
ncbi:MAG: tRNA preQ1(34) S-adenosylmethionine ribosyltransferase-isomerase QueA [Leptolyngbyaceae cyanobacterium bins.349]|nr:tRNA preQ1(34) S-adenosylmethionine ribosyltransferase-isomerase QueA [Leptolyngbyaceae cyanobacterium bins.349]